MEEDGKLKADLDDEGQLDKDEEPVAQYAAAQRELVTQPLDFNLSTLADMVGRDQIDTNPRYQRRDRWSLQRQSRLIESFLMNVPVPPVFLAEDDYGEYSVIDGKQRLRAIHAYFAQEYALTGLKVFSDLNGLRMDELPNDIRSILTMRPSLRCIIILKQSAPDIKFDVFERLNTGGISLNAQEIRNSVYRGALNNLILDLSEDRLLRRLLRVKNPSNSAIVQKMRDCELVLRFLALQGTWRGFRGSMNRTLNDYMESHRQASASEIAELRASFLATLSSVEAAFGEYAFVRWDPRQRKWGKTVLASLFDAQMLACVQLGSNADVLRAHQAAIIRKSQGLYAMPEFQDAIDVGTNQPSKLRLRVERVHAILASLGKR